MHHRHHNHRIKIVPFNQADSDQTIPIIYTVLCMYTNFQFERIWDTCETIGSCKCFLSSEHVFLA